MGYNPAPDIAAASQAYPTDAGLLSRIASMESGGNPNSVNRWDSNAKAGHPSAGLFQYIRPTFESFSRQAKAANPGAWNGTPLDWMNPRAQALTTSWAIAHGHGGDWSTYKRALAGSGKSVLGRVSAAAVSAASQAASGVDPQKLAEVSMLFSDDPSFAGIVQQNLIDQSAQAPAVSISGASSGPSLNIPKPGKGPTLPYLEKLGAQFGLKNDPGNAQTTGGHHADGSMHYQGRAIDYGDARNSPQQLLGAMKYFRSHPGTVQDAYYNPAGGAIVRGKWVPGYREPGHDNHMHIDA